MLQHKSILLISPEEWDFIFVSKHHYAMELAKRGNLVYFLNPPQKDASYSPAIKPVEGVPNLFIVNYKVRFRGLRFFPGFFMRWAERRFLKTIEEKAGVQFDIIWNFENSRFYDFNFAGKNRTKIYFQVDDDQVFHPAKAASTADISLAINAAIFETIKPYNQNTHLVPHSFQGNISPLASKVLQGEYVYQKTEGPVKVMYVGNLEHNYINIPLFTIVVQKNQDVQFQLVGPYDKTKTLYQQLSKYPNVNFMGKVPYSKIPEILDAADALMLVYGNGFHFSSHKLLEYLGSGKAIISSYMSEYDKNESLLYMAKSEEDYPDVFRNVISNISAFNSPSLMKERIAFAMDHSYSKQLDRIEKLIADSVQSKNN